MRRKAAIAIGSSLLIVGVAGWLAGSLLVAPVPKKIGELPPDLTGGSVTFASDSGSQLHGWLIPGQPGHGIVVIMHGVRANRLDMLERARFLARAGYGVFLFDFQAHGESAGRQITFGYLESRDARAAVAFARAAAPQEKIGVIGVSMGGASALLATPPLRADAYVLEQVYPVLSDAIEDRVSIRLGPFAAFVAPLLSWQIRPRLGVEIEALRPLDHVGKVAGPKLFIGGLSDQHTTPDELRRLFEAAVPPKDLWILPGAKHVDLCRFAKTEYENRVGAFFSQHLSASH